MHLGSLFAAERGIGHHDVVAVFLLYVGDVLRQRVGVDDVGSFDPVQDHVHRANDVGQRLLFLGVKGRLLERATVFDGQ